MKNNERTGNIPMTRNEELIKQCRDGKISVKECFDEVGWYNYLYSYYFNADLSKVKRKHGKRKR